MKKVLLSLTMLVTVSSGAMAADYTPKNNTAQTKTASDYCGFGGCRPR